MVPKLKRTQISNHFTYYERFVGFLEMVSKDKFKVQVRILVPKGFTLRQLLKSNKQLTFLLFEHFSLAYKLISTLSISNPKGIMSNTPSRIPLMLSLWVKYFLFEVIIRVFVYIIRVMVDFIFDDSTSSRMWRLVHSHLTWFLKQNEQHNFLIDFSFFECVMKEKTKNQENWPDRRLYGSRNPIFTIEMAWNKEIFKRVQNRWIFEGMSD